ncbi:MAG: hypothetical protein V3U78_09885 [Thiotrichaceae bacterium]
MSNDNIVHKVKLRESLKGVGVPEALKMSERRWYQNKSTKNLDDDCFLFQTVEAMKAAGNNIILDHICEVMGGCFTPYEDGCETSKNVMADSADMLDRVSKVWTTCAKSLEDGVIDDQEAIEIEDAARNAMQIITSFIDNIKSQRYR